MRRQIERTEAIRQRRLEQERIDREMDEEMKRKMESIAAKREARRQEREEQRFAPLFFSPLQVFFLQAYWSCNFLPSF